jgi:hypothetical protein
LVAGLAFTGCPSKPAQISVSANTVFFDEGETEATLAIRNTGGLRSTLTYTIESSHPWVTVDRADGTIRRSGRDIVTVTLDREEAAAKAVTTAMLTITPNVGEPVEVTVTMEPDYYTEVFGANNPIDLEETSVTFIPDGTGYEADAAEAAALPGATDTEVLLTVADPVELDLGDDSVALFGEDYSTVYIGSNGALSFTDDALDNTDAMGLADYFAAPRVAGLFAQLDPNAGQVSYGVCDTGLAVSYENVEVDGDADTMYTFQVEMMFDGTIRITHLEDGGSPEAIVGLSDGAGVPDGFVSTDLSSYNTGAVE